MLRRPAPLPPTKSVAPPKAIQTLDKFGLVCLAVAGFESQMSLLSSLEKFEGRVKLPGKESSEVVITELVRANQGFGSSVRLTKSVSVLFFGFKSHLELLSS